MTRRRLVLLGSAVLAAAGALVFWAQDRARPAGPLRIGYRHSPPYYSIGPEGRPRGMAVEVLALAASRRGIPVVWKQISGPSEDALISGEIDLWPTLTARTGRPMRVRLTEPWLQSEYFLLVPANGPIRSAADAGRKRIATIARWAESDLLGRHYPGATVVNADSSGEKLQKLCSGAADAAFVEGREGQDLLLDRPDGCGTFPLAFFRVPGAAWQHAIATTAAGAARGDELRAEIARMSDDGTLSRTLANWAFTTTNETQVVYALQQSRQRIRMSLVALAGLAAALAISLWQVRRARGAHRLERMASRALRDYARQQERYRLLVERNLAGVLRSTLDGRILECNDAAARMLGYSGRDDLMARPAWDLYASRADREAFLARLRESGALTSFEQDLRHKDGAVVRVIENVSLVDGEDGQQFIEATLLDVTGLRQLEEQYRQAQKLESIGRLAGGVAHDFNNLLTAINGYAELALSELPPGAEVRESVEEIGRAGRQAAALTQQLLAFSRKQLLQPEVLDLNAVVAGGLKLLARVIGEHIEIETDLDPELGCVRADRSQLMQVLMNLAVNARDAMPGGGRLHLATRNVTVADTEVQGEPEAVVGDCVRLTVADTGEGMDDDTRRRAFEPFFTTKERGKGTGLGLSTVYGIVKQSGGHVVVRSQPGRGSVFEIDLPRVAAAPVGERVAPPVPAHRGSETLLLVEDQAEVRALALEALKRAGYRVLVAPDGLSGLETWRANRDAVALVVADVIMPGMNGPALAEAIRRESPGVRVLFISGYASTTLTTDSLSSEGVDYLPKPFTPSALTSRVRQLLEAPPPA